MSLCDILCECSVLTAVLSWATLTVKIWVMVGVVFYHPNEESVVRHLEL